MAYADWTYYSTVWLGTAIAQSDFNHLALIASNYIDNITYGRAAPIVTAATDTVTIAAIQNATCAIAEEYQKQGLTGDEDAVNSESQGEYSVTYKSTAKNNKSNDTKRLMVARDWLASTFLLFPGFNDGEYGSSMMSDGFIN
jgi:type III secretory pathway component EscR